LVRPQAYQAFEFAPKVKKQLSKLDKSDARKVLGYLKEKVASQENPRVFGKELKGNLGGLWRYRVGNYWIISEIQDEKLVVLVIRVGHRKNIY